VSETLNLKPNTRVLDAFLVPNSPGLMGSGVSTRCTATYQRGPIAGGVIAGGVVATERTERAMAPVAGKARTVVHVFAAPGTDAQLFGQQKTQLHTMWALRGLDPWSEPT
jgi:hypothetical protein